MKLRTPDEVSYDIGEQLMESGIGIGTHNIAARQLKAAELENKEWEAAYKELFAMFSTAELLLRESHDAIDYVERALPSSIGWGVRQNLVYRVKAFLTDIIRRTK